MENKGIGLVLSGGGAKGAYQIGVFKALHKFNLNQYITGVSGTSVGALNSVLYVCASIAKAEEIWGNVGQGDFLHFDIKEFIKNNKGIPIQILLNKLFPLYSISTITNKISLYSFLMNLNGGVFSQKKLYDMLNNDIIMEELMYKKYDIFTTTCPGITSKINKKVDYHNWNNKSKNEIINIILGSSALPFIYSKRVNTQNMDSKQIMCDGGLVDNTPIKPLYDIGYRDFIVVYLNNDNSIKKSNKKKRLNKLIEEENKIYPDARIVRIIPSDNNFKDNNIQTFKLDKGKSLRLIETGYIDTAYILNKNKMKESEWIRDYLKISDLTYQKKV